VCARHDRSHTHTNTFFLYWMSGERPDAFRVLLGLGFVGILTTSYFALSIGSEDVEPSVDRQVAYVAPGRGLSDGFWQWMYAVSFSRTFILIFPKILFVALLTLTETSFNFEECHECLVLIFISAFFVALAARPCVSLLQGNGRNF
jgi:hypothetical protein